MIYTTLNKIRAHDPCKPSWVKLLAHLGKTKADDAPLRMIEILDVLGLDDALWCLRSIPEHGSLARHYAVDCVERVRHLMTGKRSTRALTVARKHAQGLASDEELEVAQADAARADATAWAARADATAWAAAAAVADTARAADAAWDAADWAADAAAAVRTAGAANAALDTERQWQSDRFRHLMTVGVWEPVK